MGRPACHWNLLPCLVMSGRGARILFGRVSTALVCAAFSVFVLLLCVLAGIHFKRAAEQEGYRETQNIARLLMVGFDDDAATADAILTRIAGEIAEQDLSEARETELHRLLRSYALPPSMLGPGVADRDGTLVASALANPVPNLSISERKIFRAHADAAGESGLYISTPIRGVLTHEWAIQFSRALRDTSGRFYGVVLLSYRLSHFIRLYEKLKLRDRGLAGLTGKDGVVRIRTLNGEIGYGSSVSRIPIVYDRVLAGETSGTFVGRGGPDDVTRIGTFVVSQTTPFYVIVGYDVEGFSTRYIGFFYLLGLCWFVLTAAIVAATALIRRLEEVKQQSRLEIVESAISERQKISADMHDSIGASLAALLAYFTTRNVDLADVRRKIGDILMELRFLVDSTETDAGDINLLLSSVRHRMGSGIELAGIALSWQVGELPQIPELTTRDGLTIKLVLMEAISNILHHSTAKRAALSASYDEHIGAIIVTLRDDGRGFDPAAVSPGRGLANMRKRMASISSGGAISIASSPGSGTTILIKLRVRPSRSGDQPG
jgi:signal transduction histidine kinase